MRVYYDENIAPTKTIKSFGKGIKYVSVKRLFGWDLVPKEVVVPVEIPVYGIAVNTAKGYIVAHPSMRAQVERIITPFRNYLPFICTGIPIVKPVDGSGIFNLGVEI
jgi:hypothetical protein